MTRDHFDTINSEKLKAVENILVEPIIKPLSENFLKIRRNLLALSIFILLYKVQTFDVEHLCISGITLKKGSITIIEGVGFLVIFYQFIHFFLEAWEHCHYLRIRVTGTKLAHVTAGKFAAEGGDYPNDPDQSTLYSWCSNKKTWRETLNRKKMILCQW